MSVKHFCDVTSLRITRDGATTTYYIDLTVTLTGLGCTVLFDGYYSASKIAPSFSYTKTGLADTVDNGGENYSLASPVQISIETANAPGAYRRTSIIF